MTTAHTARYPLALPNVCDHSDVRAAAQALHLMRTTPRDVVLGYPAEVRADWNLAALFPSPFDGDLTRALRKASRANRYSPIARRLVAVSGDARSAKTLSVLCCLLDICAAALRNPQPLVNESGAVMDPIPIVWVSPQDSGVKGLVRAIAAFFGLREPASRSTAEILKDVHRACRDHGTQFIVIDDLHGLRTGATGESITLLREVVAALPATLVLIGIDIRNPDHSVLWGKASRRHDATQVRGRIHWIETSGLDSGSAKECKGAMKAWGAYFRTCLAALHLREEYSKDEGDLIAWTLAELTSMLYGAALDLLTEAASEACLRSERLTPQLIAEVARERDDSSAD